METSQLKVLSTLHNVEHDKSESEKSVEQSKEDTQVNTKYTENEFDEECFLDMDQEEEEKCQEDYNVEGGLQEDYKKLSSSNTFFNTDAHKDNQQLENLEKELDDSKENFDEELFHSFSSSFTEKDENKDNRAQLRDSLVIIHSKEQQTDHYFNEKCLTENLSPVTVNDTIGFSHKKPTFINSQGITGFQEYEITDDESKDGQESVSQFVEEMMSKTGVAQKYDLVLSFLNSHTFGERTKQAENLQSRSSIEESSQHQSIKEEYANPLKNYLYKFVSEELEMLPESNVSGTHQAILEPPKKASPRPPIRSISTSFDSKAWEEKSEIITDRKKQCTSLPEEIETIVEHAKKTSVPVKVNDSIGFSQTKPTFINSQGIAGFQEYEITDDESKDGQESVSQFIVEMMPETGVPRKDDLVLSFLNSNTSGKGTIQAENVRSRSRIEESEQHQSIEEEYANPLQNYLFKFVSEELEMLPESNVSGTHQAILEPPKKASPRPPIRSISTSFDSKAWEQKSEIITDRKKQCIQ
ncbi:U1 small nuclear ribonucleoprotein component SNU71-like [Copidosoma floridanum]|uniref:U1 small nuclear ribonucleoprotein component SNU71-like n=1 Tax=Copidosoma floridanum TaxID=29053 RepID=UPI000C6FAE3F|nr:U1 small nuclear ribonucleoprotein component SNU71-like [Copidosoma floridanum]